MLDKFGLVFATGGGSDSKNLSPVLAAERRGFVLVEMNQGCLECLKDSWPVVVPERRKLPRVVVQFFPFGRVLAESRKVQVGVGLRRNENEFVRINGFMNSVVVVVLFIFFFCGFFSDRFSGVVLLSSVMVCLVVLASL